MACPGLILAGAKKNIRGGRKKNQVGQNNFFLRFFFCTPKKNLPLRQKSILPPGTEQARGGGGQKEK